MESIKKSINTEEITNAVSHGIGIGLSIAGLVVLVVLASMFGDAWYVVSFSIYGATSIMLYLASTLYHSAPEGKAKSILKIFDHSAIFLLIAGSYTPLTLITLRGKLGWSLFGIVWFIAIAGIVFKVFFVKKFKTLSTILYILMGWLVVVAIKPLFLALNTKSIVFLVVGGVLYTIGTIFYSWAKLKYNHAIWHMFVLGGSVCHFFTMLFLIPR
ncbi:channel protein hemolysin III family [Gottschalkia acidurici 9a]|uniref:Channel protein hemolysin III family n=1 Tax=Gottschalkia acidurici (strain ATCC 7906 / DSM 604 / BCRC 14475 / CIP 104303 / KCTC 5404 / NCIMB 10678 / 9a) TaxID=1128398 RepID=K0AY32_GOTA9|nr:hemolysin III family protein [Gottschalkia acidurici]AFS78134.1 channel protein hemolysin III family [Gottschalkia acidurici 9a]